MYKLLGFLALVLVAQSTTTGLENIFAQVPEATLSKSISALVQMNTSDSQMRLKEIADLLYEIQALIDDQQTAHDNQIEKERAQCDQDISTLEASIDTLETNLENYKKSKQQDQEEQGEKQNQLETEEQNLLSYEEDLKQAKADLDTESSAFQLFVAGFDDAIAACEEAIRLLTQLTQGNVTSFIQKNRSSGVMFVQLSQRFSEVKDILETHVQRGGPGAFVQPIVDVLAELSTQNKLDTGKVTQIIELIQTLLARLRQGKTERQTSNERTEADLNTLITNLNADVTRSRNTVQTVGDRINDLSTNLANLELQITQAEEQLLTNQTVLGTTKADCEEAENQYTTQTSQRNSNLALLAKLIEHYESQIVGAVNNVRDEAI